MIPTVLALLGFTAGDAGPVCWMADSLRSSVSFSVAHMVIRRVHGRFDRFDASVTVTGTDWSTARVRATVQTSSITTDNTDRDEHLRSSDFLDVPGFPSMAFRSSAVRQVGAGHFEMRGVLTLRGVTRSVTLAVTADDVGTDAPRFSATGSLDRRAFGIDFSETDLLASVARAVPIVGDEVAISLTLELVRTPCD